MRTLRKLPQRRLKFAPEAKKQRQRKIALITTLVKLFQIRLKFERQDEKKTSQGSKERISETKYFLGFLSVQRENHMLMRGLCITATKETIDLNVITFQK